MIGFNNKKQKNVSDIDKLEFMTQEDVNKFYNAAGTYRERIRNNPQNANVIMPSYIPVIGYLYGNK